MSPKREYDVVRTATGGNDHVIVVTVEGEELMLTLPNSVEEVVPLTEAMILLAQWLERIGHSELLDDDGFIDKLTDAIP